MLNKYFLLNKMTLKFCWNCGTAYDQEHEYCKCLKSLYETNGTFGCVKCGYSMSYKSRCFHKEMKEITPKKTLKE